MKVASTLTQNAHLKACVTVLLASVPVSRDTRAKDAAAQLAPTNVPDMDSAWQMIKLTLNTLVINLVQKNATPLTHNTGTTARLCNACATEDIQEMIVPNESVLMETMC
jgi:hypothetical protein